MHWPAAQIANGAVTSSEISDGYAGTAPIANFPVKAAQRGGIVLRSGSGVAVAVQSIARLTRLRYNRHPADMARAERHAALRELVQTNRVTSQEHLRTLLAKRGFDVAQATLSRDIRELRLIKVPDAGGRTHYTLPPETWGATPPLNRLLPTLFVGAEGTGNLLLVKTLAGGAQAVAEALDWEEWPEILGTLAGDDTILVILRDAARLGVVQARIEKMAGEV